MGALVRIDQTGMIPFLNRRGPIVRPQLITDEVFETLKKLGVRMTVIEEKVTEAPAGVEPKEVKPEPKKEEPKAEPKKEAIPVPPRPVRQQSNPVKPTTPNMPPAGDVESTEGKPPAGDVGK